MVTSKEPAGLGLTSGFPGDHCFLSFLSFLVGEGPREGGLEAARDDGAGSDVALGNSVGMSTELFPVCSCPCPPCKGDLGCKCCDGGRHWQGLTGRH